MTFVLKRYDKKHCDHPYAVLLFVCKFSLKNLTHSQEKDKSHVQESCYRPCCARCFGCRDFRHSTPHPSHDGMR